MRLHWSPRSPFVRKVLVAAYEAGIADRLELVRTVVASTQPNLDLLRENPLGKLPTLTLQNGASIFDSTVIIEYFATFVAPDCTLLPKDPADRLVALQYESLGDGLLDLLLQWLGERKRPRDSQSEALLAANAVKFAHVIDYIDAAVPELLARPFDIGHVTVGCALSYVGFRFPDLRWQEAHPALASWLADFCQRPSVLAVPVIDDQDAPIMPPAPRVGGLSQRSE